MTFDNEDVFILKVKKSLIVFGSVLLFPIFTQSAELNNPIRNGQILFSTNHAIVIINDDGSNPRKIVFSQNNVNDPKWEPNGKFFAYKNNGSIRISSLNGKTLQEISVDGIYLRDFVWLPDSSGLIFSGSDKSNDNEKIYSVLLKDMKIERVSEKSDNDTDAMTRDNLSISPNGHELAFTEGWEDKGYQVVVLDLKTNAEIAKTSFPKKDEKGPSKHGDFNDGPFLTNLNWAEDSNQLFFERCGKSYLTYILNVTKNKTSLWGKEGDDLCFYSKEKNIAIFSSSYQHEVFISDLARKNVKQLTSQNISCGFIRALTPIKKIYYICCDAKKPTSNDRYLHVMNFDGTNEKQLSDLGLSGTTSDTFSWHITNSN